MAGDQPQRAGPTSAWRPSRNAFFAAPADDPRARRPADVAIVVVSAVLAVLLGWSHRGRSDLDRRVIEFLAEGLPGWISGIATVVFIIGGLYSFALVIGIALFGNGRATIARDMLLAQLLAFAAVIVGALLAGPEFPDFLPEVTADDGFPSYPVVRLAIAVAAIRVAGPFLTAPMRTVGRRLIAAMSLSAVALTYGTVSAVLGGLLVGAFAAASIHLIFGSGQGIPSRDRIISGLHDIGIDVADLDFVSEQPVGANLVRAELADGRSLLVKVYGRDAADAARAARAWRSVWYRDDARALTATSMQLAEHEGLMTLVCEREGVPTARLVGLGRASSDDVLLVADWIDGVRLVDVDADALDDELLDALWNAVGAFARAGIAHREIDRDRVLIGTDEVLLADVSAASIPAGDDNRNADRAQLLVATAIAVGHDRSIAAARRSLGDDGLLAILPMLQTAAMPRSLQIDAKQAKLKIAHLRSDIAAELGADAPEVVQLQRVTWGNVAMVALTAFAAYSLISALTDIGLDTIADEMSSAIWAWVVVAFLAAQLTNVGEYFSLVGVIGRPVPLGPTMLFRYALSFISLAVPSDAGAIAMNVRYQQKLGVPAAAAVAQGPLLTIVSKGFDVILLLITARYLGEAIDTGDIDFGPVVRLVTIIVIAAVVAIVVVLAVPKLRASMLPHVKEGFGAIRGSLTDPQRLSKIVGGTLMQKILFAITLAASVAAYGQSISFGQALFVNTAVSLFVGLVPVPGGIGVAEAGLAAGLIAVGVPEEAAFAAAITHRMVTAYIPPLFGWWASRWLTQRDYL